MYVFKDMMFQGNQKSKGQPLHGSAHSKLFKEFTNLVTSGTNKISFIQFKETENGYSKNGKSASNTKYNAFVDSQLAKVRIPLIKSSVKIESEEQFINFGVSSKQKLQRRQIIEFSELVEQQQEEAQAKHEANIRIQQSNSRERIKLANQKSEERTLTMQGSNLILEKQSQTLGEKSSK